MNKAPHLVHVFPAFGMGGMQLRMASIINALGSEFRHTIVSLNGDSEAADAVSPGTAAFVLMRKLAPRGPLVLRKTIRDLGPNLLLTYNWGAFDALMGSAIFSFCPVVHNECGFGVDESVRLKWRRAFLRRVFLPRIHRTIVVSNRLVRILQDQVRLPPRQVRFIRTGVDTKRFRVERRWDWRRAAGVSDRDLLFGFVGRLGPEKNLAFLLQAFAEANIPDAKLALIGDGPLRDQLAQAGRDRGIADRLIFTGFVKDTAPYFMGLDVFLMSSITEQTPNALLQATATGLPCICTDAGDTACVLGPSPYVCGSGNLSAYIEALRGLASSQQLRESVGTANRQRCESEYSFSRMVAEYADEYRSAHSY